MPLQVRGCSRAEVFHPHLLGDNVDKLHHRLESSKSNALLLKHANGQ
jgi:hypothetical protein